MRRALLLLLLVAAAARADQALLGLCSAVENAQCTATTAWTLAESALTPSLVSPSGGTAAFQIVVTEGASSRVLTLTDVLTLSGLFESGTQVRAIFLGVQKADASGAFTTVASAVAGDASASCGCPFVPGSMAMTARDGTGNLLSGAPLATLAFGQQQTVVLGLSWDLGQGLVKPGDVLRLQPCVAYAPAGVSLPPGCFADGGGVRAVKACSALALGACAAAPAALTESLGSLSCSIAALGGFGATASAPTVSPPSVIQVPGGAAVSFTVTPTGVPGTRSVVTVQGKVTCQAAGSATLADSAALAGAHAAASVAISCSEREISVGDFCTYTQGGWGSACHGGNPGCIRDASFSAIFKTALGCGQPGLALGADSARRAGFGTAAAVRTFLPQGSTAGTFAGALCDPSSSTAGVFAGQLLALKLNLGFGDAGVLPKKNGVALGDLVMVSGPCAGLTARDVLSRGEIAISGAVSAGTTCVSVSDLSEAADAINNDFDNCTQDLGALRKP